MHVERNTFGLRSWLIPFYLLPGLIFLIYSNSLDASWHLDDYQNIVEDTRIHLHELTPDSLWQATASIIQKPRDARPLSRLTFALNWFFGQKSPTGYHVVNISIHALTAIFLFLTVRRIFQSPNISAVHRRNHYTIALFASVLWSINPIQTQAVTYIVQRMAILAAMFYVFGIYLYVRGRTSSNSRNRLLYYLGCFLSAGCAIASKENAATFPLALLLVEFLFYQDLSRKKTYTLFWGIAIVSSLVVVSVGIWFFFNGDPHRILNYQFRYFSPLERLLTQPRVLLLYLSQIFFPVPTRLSIEHDITVSTSLFAPWSTLPAVLLIGSIIIFALFSIRKRPVASFAILFFFLNHVIESTIIGLELIFEHRNYLPSLFLFVPVAAGACQLLEFYRERNRMIFRTVILLLVVITTGFCVGTYIRNFAWQSEKSLWNDAVVKAPRSGRAWHNLAMTYYVPTGQFDKAMVLYRKALVLEKNNLQQESIIYSNIAAGYYYRGDYEQAVQYWTKALQSYHNNPEVKYRLVLTLFKMGNFEKALKHLDQLAAKFPSKNRVLNLKGILAVSQGNYREALSYFRECFKPYSTLTAAFFNAGVACSLSGHFQRAEWFFKTYLAQHANDELALLWLAQNSMIKGDLLRSESYLNRLFRMMPIKDVMAWVGKLEDQILYNDTIIIPKFDSRIHVRLQHKFTSGSSPQNPRF